MEYWQKLTKSLISGSKDDELGFEVWLVACLIA
jgi:hypothetical protein